MDIAKRINCSPKCVYFFSKMRKIQWLEGGAYGLPLQPSACLFLSETRGNVGYDHAGDYLCLVNSYYGYTSVVLIIAVYHNYLLLTSSLPSVWVLS